MGSRTRKIAEILGNADHSTGKIHPDNLHRERKIRINDPLDMDVYEGCRFRARCPYAIEKCIEEPSLEGNNVEHHSACFVKLD